MCSLVPKCARWSSQQRGLIKDDHSRPPRWSASNQAWHLFGCRSRAFRGLQPRTAPAKEAAAKGVWEARQTGHVACPSFPPPDPVPVRKCARGPRTNYAAPSGAHRKMRGTECVHSPAPFIGRRRIAVGDRQSNRPNLILVPDWTIRRTRKKGRNRSRFPPCRSSQNSSSMPPWTVWTTRAARCAGKML